jgi:hypothetical protein
VSSEVMLVRKCGVNESGLCSVVHSGSSKARISLSAPISYQCLEYRYLQQSPSHSLASLIVFLMDYGIG